MEYETEPQMPMREPRTWPTRLTGVGLLLLALALAASLLSYQHAEMGWDFLNPTGGVDADAAQCTNWLGLVGLYLAGLCNWFLGAASLYAQMLLAVFAVGLIFWPRRPYVCQMVAMILLVLFACAIVALQPWFLADWKTVHHLYSAGGLLGYLDGCLLVEPLVGTRWALVSYLLLHALGWIYFARFTFIQFWREVWYDFRDSLTRWRDKHESRREQRRAERDQIRRERNEQAERSVSQIRARNGRTSGKPQGDLFPDSPDDNNPSDNPVPMPGRRREVEQGVFQRPPTGRDRQYTPSGGHSNLLDLMEPAEPEIDVRKVAKVDASRPGTVSGETEVKPRLKAQVERRMGSRTPEPASAGTVSRAADKPAPATKAKGGRGGVSADAKDTRVQYEDYPLPPYDLLKYEPVSQDVSAAAQREMDDVQQRIIETLETFRISVEPGAITRGPSITRYEFYPPRGRRVGDFTKLDKDIMLATSSKSVNILAPIPGKNTVGIELENAQKSPVYLRELLQSENFNSPKLRIPVALGKDVYGNAVIGDLAAMPHTLVAGTTGSGKSVCINSMILSMLYKFRPEELKLILVDPKVVEMQPYRKLPHLICPVVTQPGRVIGALRWAVNEMERRYRLFSQVGVRNFEDFNNREDDGPIDEPEEEEDTRIDYAAIEAMASEIERQAEDEVALAREDEQDEFEFDDPEPIPLKLPYIVIIIDELADLMMVVKEDLENYIARLTQKARAAGIHLVAATQTPRANVVTGIIKANIPSRIAFRVASPLDSRIIIDQAGAENLLGKGDSLFLPPGGITKMTRVQGAFVSDAEIAKIIAHCAAHAKQKFEQGVAAEMDSAEGGSPNADNGGRIGTKNMNDEEAELYTRCVQLVVTERKASTSLLQRRFSIGYGRAAKIMDMMEENGIISAPSGATRAREVLVDAP